MSGVTVSAIVPSAGMGSRIRRRLKGSVPKPYLPLGGMPILTRTLAKLEAIPEVCEIIVACHPRYRKRVMGMASRYGIKKLRRVVLGGPSRTASVYRALQKVDPTIRYVLIHDGVRPFLSSQTIRKLIGKIKRGSPAWVVGRPMIPTVKEVRNGGVVQTIERGNLWEVETPQIFEKGLLRSAYRHYFREPFAATDDASLIEHMGAKVRVFPVIENNLKITTLEDLGMAKRLFPDGELRTGWGEDRHRLVPAKPLYLGGVQVPSPWGAIGHSDGDVILHAVVDAILGALGRGDIGEHFPNTDARYRGMRSARFLKKALKLAAEAHFEIVNVDTCLILESPKLGSYKKKIQRNIASLTGLEPSRIGVKAKTAEGLGPEGKHEAITAHAVVTLSRSREASL